MWEKKKIGLGIRVDTADTFYTILTFTYRNKKKLVILTEIGVNTSHI